MFKPTKMTRKQQVANDKMLELRLKYEDFIGLDEDLEDEIIDCGEVEFQRITKQFRNAREYLKAVHMMENSISRGQEVPNDIVCRIKQTREDFKAALTH